MRTWLLLGTALCLGVGGARAADDEGFRAIFDGKTLTGWDGNSQFWSVEDGAITGMTTAENPTRGNTFIVWRDGELDDFELRLEYRIVGGNSGVQYRSWEDEEKWGKWVVGGYQGDLEAGKEWSGALYGERFRGALAKRGQATVVGNDHKPKVVASVGDSDALQGHIRNEDWNEYSIRAQGFEFVHQINGHVTAKVSDQDLAMRRRTGILALQLHAGPPMKVQFRNIRLKRLPLGDAKKVVFVAGKRSHGYGAHEHRAGSLLLAKALNDSGLPVHAIVHSGGWPSDVTAFDNADAVVIYADGGGRHHPINPHADAFDQVLSKGVGLACLHYAVEVESGPVGNHFLDWIGGYFEMRRSVNPHWVLSQPLLAEGHPITDGVGPFTADDEWYYNMRFRDGMEGVTPMVRAIPPLRTRERKSGSHSGNPLVRARRGMYETVAWAFERPGGGRGFGFTGGHVHDNWANDDLRTLVLNAITWISGAEVPLGGVPSRTPSREDLEANQDYPKPGGK